MRHQESFPYPRPPVRSLKIYAFDPMIGLDRRTRISVETRNEPLQPGPLGARIVVVDYDTAQDCYYVPVDLDDSAILMQGGIDHSEGDPRFHQQMVYAVATRIVEVFDRALGRPVDLGSSGRNGKPKPIRLFPHAFAEANAFYDPTFGAIFFGYFRATENVAESKETGNIPGQIIFSCLSHDVIAHELTHALIHQLSPALINSEHPDTLALHEALSDLVAILHRFSLETLVRDEIERTHGNLDVSSPLGHVATQFGHAIGKGQALRSANMEADPTQYATVMEPHDRGALVISAALEALFRAYKSQVQDLMEIAGATQQNDKRLHPDLINRLATEVSRLAKSLLTMCIRAFDYLPPVDVSFGDFLRSVVTADWELAPDDSSGLRTALIESFRRRGIYATGARSLAEESLIWERPTHSVDPLPTKIVAALTQNAQAFGRIRPGEGEGSAAEQATRAANKALSDYAKDNARALHMWTRNATLRPPSARYCFRVGADGQLAVDIVAKFIQERPASAGMQYRGTTLVASADGTVRYIITNQPVPRFESTASSNRQAAVALREGQQTPKSHAAPFPARFRMTVDEYKSQYPALSLTSEEMQTIRQTFNFAYDPEASQ